MNLRRLRKSVLSPQIRRRACALTFLGAYLVAATGVPVAVPVAVDRSTPFPCQHHRCGCASADQCWDQCCCFTHAEKLAWARQHGVAVPEHVASRGGESTPSDGGSEIAAKGCGHSAGGCGHGDSSCASSHTVHPKATSCCDEVAEAAVNSRLAANDTPGNSCGGCETQTGEPASSTVLVFRALKCRGCATDWVTVGAVGPLPSIIEWQFDWSCRERLTPYSPLLLSAGNDPPVPPPRIS